MRAYLGISMDSPTPEMALSSGAFCVSGVSGVWCFITVQMWFCLGLPACGLAGWSQKAPPLPLLRAFSTYLPYTDDVFIIIELHTGLRISYILVCTIYGTPQQSSTQSTLHVAKTTLLQLLCLRELAVACSTWAEAWRVPEHPRNISTLVALWRIAGPCRSCVRVCEKEHHHEHRGVFGLLADIGYRVLSAEGE